VVARFPGLSATGPGWHAARATHGVFTGHETIHSRTGWCSEHLASHRRWRAKEEAVLGGSAGVPTFKRHTFMKGWSTDFSSSYESIRGKDASWAHLYGANASIKYRALPRGVGGYDEQNPALRIRGHSTGAIGLSARVAGCG